MADTGVDELLHLLRWCGRLELAESKFNAWVTALSDRLGTVLGELIRDGPGGEKLLEQVRGLADAGLTRILTSPAASDHLLWSERHERRETLEWLSHAVDSERAVIEKGNRRTSTGWTALGDAEIKSGQILRTPRIGAISVDWESPGAKAIDRKDMALWEDLTASERSDVLARTERACNGLGAVNPDGLSVVMRFTRVLMLQKRGGIGFRTRSPERRIGLTLFQNPHLSSVDDVDLAEGLVHEAIHSVLDIDERLRQLTSPAEKCWVRELGLYDGASRVSSPWTGARLALPTFLQACFVWYGLLHHWCLALSTNVFERHRVKARIAQSASGFLRESLVDLLGEHRNAVGLDIRDALNQMQRDVTRNFGEILRSH